MVRPSLVPSAAVMVSLLLLTYTGVSLARTLGFDNENFDNSFNKRNSWWSKKSVDTSSDLTPVLPDASIEAGDMDENPDAYTKLYGCYVATCVPEFIACARRSRTTSTFEMCKLEHRTCAMRCWELANDDAAK
ncbi:uncharacterized protein LOC112574066 [Pomacea canaliculata]|uniref:uncharacterized protein LOC112574066 n=1 Tax=Pomacea canaliculata TaxID=400727 RepID=UPI000D734994|nr:uncharacterized protein LOC112574066 [Pomacea canaliculata]